MILASSSLEVSLLLILAAAGIFSWIVTRPAGGTRYKVGDEVQWLTTLRIGRVIQVREDDLLYVVEFDDGEVRVLHEERLC